VPLNNKRKVAGGIKTRKIFKVTSQNLPHDSINHGALFKGNASAELNPSQRPRKGKGGERERSGINQLQSLRK
jgi:hypothetical protein